MFISILRSKTFRALLVSALTVLVACDAKLPLAQSQPFHSIDVTGATYAQGFALPDADGKVRNLKEFAGKIPIVFFGYTQCPDVCPTTLAELAELKKKLGKDGERLQAIFITVDPERDTSAVLKAYMQNFDASFIALRPDSAAQLEQVGRDFKIYYKKVDGKTASSYTMDHTAGSYVFDPAGQLRLFTRYGAGVDALLADIKQLL